MSDLITHDRVNQALSNDVPHVDCVTLFSGRWYCFRQWYESFRALVYPLGRISYHWYTNARDRAFVAMLAQEAARLGTCGLDIRLTVDPSIQVSRNAHREMQPGEAFPADHCDAIAALYNRACAPTTGDLFFLEDDVSCSPMSLIRLQAACQDHGAGYATARLYDRHSPGLFLWDLVEDEAGEATPKNVFPLISGVLPIGLGPLGCTYIPRWAYRAISEPKWKPYPLTEWQGGMLAGCDMVLCLEMARLSIPRVCDFGLFTQHWDSQGRAH